MSDYSKHKKEVAGLNMTELSKSIVDLHYESLAELFQLLSKDFMEVSSNDYKLGNTNVAYELNSIGWGFFKLSPHADKIWQISKPFMEQK